MSFKGVAYFRLLDRKTNMKIFYTRHLARANLRWHKREKLNASKEEEAHIQAVADDIVYHKFIPLLLRTSGYCSSPIELATTWSSLP